MRISYYLFIFIARLFAALPFRLLYLLSDLFCLLLIYVIPYRKKVIQTNIERSFPNLTQQAHQKIIKGFYHNFCDIIVEGIKGFTITKKDLQQRYVFVNPEVMNDLYAKGKSVVAVGAHYANWEWGIMAAPLALKHKLYAFYTPLTNKPIDTYMRQNRKKWGTELVPGSEIKNVFNATHNEPVLYFFGADQSPSKPEKAHWMEFLNQDTACLTGAESFAKSYELPMLYFDVQRIKKGHYAVTITVLENDPVNTSPGEITENYMRTLEQIIRKKPEDYLWSHRRWKHSRKENLRIPAG
ncbi:MAG: lysophospholipid acyltransferase family protein [Chitinophagales bacterium]|nr:lysophospholipid acyltransferase family protein [Chitinophagales bacterium]